MYVDRVVRYNPLFLITSNNVHRYFYYMNSLYLTCVMIADKFHSDEFFENSDYAIVGGIKGDEINELEIELLSLIEFDVNITDQEFSDYLNRLNAISTKLKKFMQKKVPDKVSKAITVPS